MATLPAMAKVHPIAAQLEADGKQQKWLVERVVAQGGKLHKGQLSRILSGRQGVSREQALALSRALRGKVKAAAIVFWRPSARKAA